MSDKPGPAPKCSIVKGKNLTDENKAWIFMSLVVVVLAALAIGVTALVLVLYSEKTIVKNEETIKKTNKTIYEFRNVQQEFADNTTKLFKANNETREDFLKRLVDLERGRKIHTNYVFGSTWSQGNQLCVDIGYILCAYDDIFPEEGVLFKSFDDLEQNEWVPVSNRYNDWAQIGTQGNRKGTYFDQFGTRPDWGESSASADFKKRVFCCATTS